MALAEGNFPIGVVGETDDMRYDYEHLILRR